VRLKACFMDDLLREFLTETGESLDTVDNQLVRFEQDPNNAKILDNIFRLVHTIKGTCGFLGLPRLEALAHAAETLMGKFRDGMPVTGEAVVSELAQGVLDTPWIGNCVAIGEAAVALAGASGAVWAGPSRAAATTISASPCRATMQRTSSSPS